MQAMPLRGVMDPEEYKRERQRLQELYGDPDDGSENVVAKRDQAFAELFYKSGWTQEQLAAYEGKTQQWVAYRLRFGRSLGYATNTTMVVSDLTERRFRGYWEGTDKSDQESVRFDTVIRLIQAPPEPKAKSGGGGRRGKAPSPQRDKARDIVRPLVEAGLPISENKLHHEHGLAEISFREAVSLERGRLEGLQEAAESGPIDTSVLGKTAQDRFATLERRLRAQLEAEFSDRVQRGITKHIEEYVMPTYKEKLEKAELLMKIGKPFTNAQFISILRALHPDSSNAENRQAAFVLMKAKEVLLRPEEKDRPLSGGLPTSLPELLARKKTFSRATSTR